MNIIYCKIDNILVDSEEKFENKTNIIFSKPFCITSVTKKYMVWQLKINSSKSYY